MERVDASLHGWPLATWATKQETDTNYKRGARLGAAPRAHRRTCGSGSPATTCSTSPTPGCWRSAAASAPRSSSRCCWAWPPARRRWSSETVGGAAAVHARSCTRASSTSRSPTWCAGWRRAPARENFMSAVFELARRPALFDARAEPLPGVAVGLDPDPGSDRRTASQDRDDARSRRAAATASTTRRTPTRRVPPTAVGAGDSAAGCQASTLGAATAAAEPDLQLDRPRASGSIGAVAAGRGVAARRRRRAR